MLASGDPAGMDLTGLFVPLVTPFDAAGEIAVDALRSLTAEVLAAGAHGVVALGTTGEPATLTPEERRVVIEAVSEACAGCPVIVGAGSSDTRASTDALRELATLPDIGAALIAVPAFTRPSEAGVIAHFAALAEASPLPIVVYNIPYRTGRSLSVATIRALAAIPGVIGIKHAVGAIDTDTVLLLADPPPDFTVLCGDDLFAPAMHALGAAGSIMASAHLQTAAFAALLGAWQRGDTAVGRPGAGRLAPLVHALFAEPNPTVLKAVLHAEGRIPTPAVRLPLLPASADAVRVALAALRGTPGQ